MKEVIIKMTLIVGCLFVFGIAASAQDSANNTRSDDDNIVTDVLEGAGKVTVVVVRSAGKATWATTRFTAKHVAKPIVKTVIVKGTPAAAKFALKSSGTAAKHLLPVAVKLALL